MKQMGEKRILDYRVDIRGRIRVVSGSHGSLFFFEPAGSALLTFLSSSTSRNSFSLGCSERESMAARNLVPCVTIRRAESTGEDPIYTCATDEDTASRPAPRWERSTAPPPRWPWRRGFPPVDRAHGAGAGGKAGAGGPGVHVGAGSRLEERRLESDVGRRAQISFLPRPARGLCWRAPTRGSRQVDMHLAPFTCHMAPHGRPRSHSLARSGAGPGSSV